MFRPALARPLRPSPAPPPAPSCPAPRLSGGSARPREEHHLRRPALLQVPLAVSKAPKRDADGKVILDEGGYPVRADPSWFTIFNFNERAEARIESLVPGSLLYVEANIDTITSPAATDGSPGTKQYVFREVSHKVLSKPRQE
ncbi:hypothetical protein CNBG_0859 [Cryptococcus deuterogattii R265]|uniref:uncharacterized protein n=1 Tax=Cryptococcus deuterogattii (strain R265) TaxID=294750 RepID=UPI001938DA5F|nr:hypothetical protein CNBG_0859 [Cryptococcus deuterogattii R265]